MAHQFGFTVWVHNFVFDENEQTPEDGPLLSKKNCFLHTNILLDGGDESVMKTMQLKFNDGDNRWQYYNMAIWQCENAAIWLLFCTDLLQKRQGNGDMLALYFIKKL